MTPNRRGFSLVELLLAMALLAVFALLVHQAGAALLRGGRVLEAASEAQEAARIGVQLIVADVREAGFAPGGPLADGLRQASRTALAVARDLNGDGDVDDAQERVAYAYAADRRALLRAQADAPPQPLLDNLDDDGLELVYLTADGVPLDPGSGELDTDQRERVRRIAVRLRIAIPSPDPAAPAPLRSEARATAMLRNAGL